MASSGLASPIETRRPTAFGQDAGQRRGTLRCRRQARTGKAGIGGFGAADPNAAAPDAGVPGSETAAPVTEGAGSEAGSDSTCERPEK